jgi:hypothetical protein
MVISHHKESHRKVAFLFLEVGRSPDKQNQRRSKYFGYRGRAVRSTRYLLPSLTQTCA